MFLGIEIGGTKLQLGVGSGASGSLVALERMEVERARGAEGIRKRVGEAGQRLIAEHKVRAVGIGFGGPVDASAGKTIRSFHIEGWNDFPLAEWSERTLGRPTALENDSNLAGLGEARFGSGRGEKVVFYSNVGSGIGGALVVDGTLYTGGSGIAVAEVGHLRPGPEAVRPEQTVESVASGWALADAARARLTERSAEDESAASDLLSHCEGRIENLSGKMVGEAAAEGNPLAGDVLRRAIQTYGWALAQVVTLLSPNVVVVGGGVPQIGESLFFTPLREEVDRYVMPPLRGTYKIVPARLGEEVVVHGALAIASGIPQS